jgi:phosphoglycolate phosphatase-like HAD superfamily hydrolase
MDKFTRAQVEELREALTMLDIYRARKLTKDQVEVGLEAYHQAALRLGVVGPDTSLESFLERLGADDFNEIMGASRLPNPLGSGGESEPHSSDGTDTPPDSF